MAAAFNRRQFRNPPPPAGVACRRRGASAQDEPTPGPRLRAAAGRVRRRRGRAGSLVQGFSELKEVDIVRICDIDRRRVAAAADALEKRTGKSRSRLATPTIIDDPKSTWSVVGTPDHWHAIPTIHAASPARTCMSRSPTAQHRRGPAHGRRDAQEQARRADGTQSRSASTFLMRWNFSGAEARALPRRQAGKRQQGSIGRPPDGQPPEGVDYDTWLGPAPKRPFNPVRFHGNWRWFFDYARATWARRRPPPRRRAMGPVGRDGRGGRRAAAGAAETHLDRRRQVVLRRRPGMADTLQVDYHTTLAGKTRQDPHLRDAPFHPLPLPRRGSRASPSSATGRGSSWATMVGARSAPTSAASDRRADRGIVRPRPHPELRRLRQDPEEARGRSGNRRHPSSVLCHAGNVAWRTGKKLTLDRRRKCSPRRRRRGEQATRSAESRKPFVLPEFLESPADAEGAMSRSSGPVLVWTTLFVTARRSPKNCRCRRGGLRGGM